MRSRFDHDDNRVEFPLQELSGCVLRMRWCAIRWGLEKALRGAAYLPRRLSEETDTQVAASN